MSWHAREISDARWESDVRELARTLGDTLASAPSAPIEASVPMALFQLIGEFPWTVRLVGLGGESAEGKFTADLGPASRLHRVLVDIENNKRRSSDDMADLGCQLWDALLADPKVQGLFERIQAEALPGRDRESAFLQVRIGTRTEVGAPHTGAMTVSAEQVPWETLFDTRVRMFVSTDPRFCLVRDPGDAHPATSLPPRAAGPIRILAIIPNVPDLQTEQEWSTLKLAVARLGAGVEIERLDGEVTAAAVAERLASKPFDVVHYVGHGEARDGRPCLRLNAPDGGEADWLDDRRLALVFAGQKHVRLVVLNCCRSAGGGSWGGGNASFNLTGLGPLLLNQGVQAVVGMQYEILDAVANQFAALFYGDLFNGPHAGRVDVAIQRARRSLFLNNTRDLAREFITPVLHLVRGGGRIFDLAPPATSQPLRVSPAILSPVTVPEKLIAALKEKSCVPLVGAGVYSPVAQRGGNPPSPPQARQLAARLDAVCAYPSREEFRDYADSWFDDLLLQRVCQFVQVRRSPRELVTTIQEFFSQSPTADVARLIAAWEPPGVVYWPVDGQLYAAFKERRLEPVVLNSIRDQLENTAPATSAGADSRARGDARHTLVVQLRGTLLDPRSLVLTEEDHEKLALDLEHTSSAVTELTTGGVWRSLLVIGLSPRDPLLRRLCAKLWDLGGFPERNRGTFFFVHPHPTPADECYWARYKVQWVRSPPLETIEAMHQALNPGRGL